MSLPEQEKLKANIVVLSGTGANIAISSDEISHILRDPTVQALGQPAQQLQLMSLREQVLVLIAGGRFIFEDQSDAMPPKAKLAETVEKFINLFVSKGVSQYRAYGFNFDIAFDARGDSPAASVVMDRFVKPDQLNSRGSLSLKGAGLRLYFDMGEATCDLRIEPRENNVNSPRYFSHINYHYQLPSGQFPPPDALRSDFQGKWGVFVDLLERLLINP